MQESRRCLNVAKSTCELVPLGKCSLVKMVCMLLCYYACACRIWWDPRGSWTREYVDGKTGLSKEEEISTIKIEGDNIYEDMYIRV